MRDTMRDGSISRKPTRAASRRKNAFGLGTSSRQDSLSPDRLPQSRTPSPYDASNAAKAAQLRLAAPQPVADPFQHSRQTTPTDLIAPAPVRAMAGSLRRPARVQPRPIPEEHELQDIDLGAPAAASTIPVRYMSDAAVRSLRARTRACQPSRGSQGVAGKLKTSFSGVVGGYMDIWRHRKDYMSDEQLAIKAIADRVMRYREHKRLLSPAPDSPPREATALPQGAAVSSTNRRFPATTAWPQPDRNYSAKASKPSASQRKNAKLMVRPPSPPKPTFARRGVQFASIGTTNTSITQWGDVQEAVNRTSSVTTGLPDANDFAVAFNKSKGKSSCKSRTPPLLPPIITKNLLPEALPNIAILRDHLPEYNSIIDFQALNNISTAPDPEWDPANHRFDPSRTSWISDAGQVQQSHTVASSIYSRPADEDRHLSPAPLVPRVPSRYVERQTPLRPVSPVSVDTSYSTFLARAANAHSPRHGRYDENEREEKVSPISEVSRPAPVLRYGGGTTDMRYDQPRGRYDFEDSATERSI